MCDPATLGLIFSGAAGLGSTLLAPTPAAPPPLPATAPDAAKKPGATVRVGDGQDDNTTDAAPVTLARTPERRVFGRPVGGLGRSGLSI